jgi:hypothetical protein
LSTPNSLKTYSISGVIMLCKHIPFKPITIWQPRYHDKRVLLAAHKVGEHNKVYFTKAPSMGTEPYYINGRTAKKFKKESNGRIECYSVPISELRPLELNERCEHSY